MQDTLIKIKNDADRLIKFGGEHEYLNRAFYNVFGRRLIDHGYIDVNYILESTTKGNYYSRMKDSPLQRLFSKGCVPSEDIEIMTGYLGNIIEDDICLEASEEEALVFWIFLPYYSNPVKRRTRQDYLLEIMQRVVKIYSPQDGREWELKIADGIVYDKNTVFLETVGSVEKYIRDIFLLKNEYTCSALFYRGHSKINYILQPGIKREQMWFENENIMYQEILVRCAGDFARCQTHLDYLVEMQHYGIPTRLLDITDNPLVALYFACCSNKDSLGEVVVMQTDPQDMKYEKSDTVAFLSALPALSHAQQNRLLELCENGINENEDIEYKKLAGRLAAEVKSRNPAFEPKIRKADLKKNIFVTPIRSNQRIMKQDGAFILCGLGDGSDTGGSLDDMRCRDIYGKKLVLVVKNKDKILKELDVLSVNKASLFPEIDDVAEYIREKYR